MILKSEGMLQLDLKDFGDVLVTLILRLLLSPDTERTE